MNLIRVEKNLYRSSRYYGKTHNIGRRCYGIPTLGAPKEWSKLSSLRF